MTEAQAWWIIAELGIVALVFLIRLLVGYTGRRP